MGKYDEQWKRILVNRKIIGCGRCGTIHAMGYVKTERIGGLLCHTNTMYCMSCFAKEMLELTIRDTPVVSGEIWWQGDDY